MLTRNPSCRGTVTGLGLAIGLLSVTGCFPGSGAAGYFLVNSTADANDANPGDGLCATSNGGTTCTLRAAVQESNALAGANTIELPAGTYNLSLAEPGGGSSDAGGDLDIEDPVRIFGAGTDTTIVDGSGITGRIFQISAGFTSLADLTVRDGGGNAQVTSGGGLRIESGIFVMLTRVLVTENTSFSNAGGIYNSGQLLLEESTIDGNETVSRGGALYNATSGTVTINRCTLSNNQATLGGAIQSFGSLTINNSTISGNNASAGTGGIINVGTLNLNNATITDNHTTLVTSGRAGGVANNQGAQPLALNIKNTIIAGNTAPVGGSPDCTGEPFNSQGYNIIGDMSGCTLGGVGAGNQTADPLLGPLADNGGATETHALLDGSPAINAGNPATPGSGADACLANDQRGESRLVCDVGAYEVASPIIIGPAPRPPRVITKHSLLSRARPSTTLSVRPKATQRLLINANAQQRRLVESAAKSCPECVEGLADAFNADPEAILNALSGR